MERERWRDWAGGIRRYHRGGRRPACGYTRAWRSPVCHERRPGLPQIAVQEDPRRPGGLPHTFAEIPLSGKLNSIKRCGARRCRGLVYTHNPGVRLQGGVYMKSRGFLALSYLLAAAAIYG